MKFPDTLKFKLDLQNMLRYGENPHQSAAMYSDSDDSPYIKLSGKDLSYNNLIDMEAAISAVIELKDPGCVIVKHANPCGAAIHCDGPSAAFKLALECDPSSAYGGIIAFNSVIDVCDVLTIKRSRTFFEIVCAKAFTNDALSELRKREKLRVIEYTNTFYDASRLKMKYLMGRWLVQEQDSKEMVRPWRIVTKNNPSYQQIMEAEFAWKMCKFVKSNAITMACSKDDGIMLCGIGAGQMSRVDAVNFALSRTLQDHNKCVMASDGFFPFPDGPTLAMEAGVKAFIQPGGSIRDEEVIGAVDNNDCVMIMTGTRHFNH
tara:strand:+ start:215 stop:1168 length:954 start_codon:yes stop_codon:yes gene_type:complete